jgi:hypothetical protein
VLAIDHVILGVHDLDAATRRMEALGFGVADGGRHQGLGTANRIVPIPRGGDDPPQYLELLGVVDRREAEGTAFGRALLARIAAGDCLTRWCFQTDDLDTIARRLTLAPEARGRVRPDGVTLTWRAAGLADSLKESWLPFYVSWNDATQHPGLTPVRHRVEPRGIAWVELSADDRPRLDCYVAGADADVRVVAGPPTLRRCAIATDAGEIVIA